MKTCWLRRPPAGAYDAILVAGAAGFASDDEALSGLLPLPLPLPLPLSDELLDSDEEEELPLSDLLPPADMVLFLA